MKRTLIIAGLLIAALPAQSYERRDSTDISPYYRYYYDRPERAAPRERPRTQNPGVPTFRKIEPGYKPLNLPRRPGETR